MLSFKIKDWLFQLRHSTRFLNIIVFCLFAIIWVDLLLAVDSDLFLWIAFFPVLLLVLCLQYASHRAYFFVISIGVAFLILNSISLQYRWEAYLLELKDPSLWHNDSVCRICDIRTSLRLLLIGMAMVAFLHNDILTQRYRWNLRSFTSSILVGYLLYWLIRQY